MFASHQTLKQDKMWHLSCSILHHNYISSCQFRNRSHVWWCSWILCQRDLLEKVSSASGMSQSRQSSMKQMQTLSAFTSTPDRGAEWLLEPESVLALGWPAMFSAFSSSHVAAWSSWPEGRIILSLYRFSFRLCEFNCQVTRCGEQCQRSHSPLQWIRALLQSSFLKPRSCKCVSWPSVETKHNLRNSCPENSNKQ